ncbi:MAG: alpha/beta hydrolase-fold protein [Roseburia sp.]|nr:alpha/beta hydrolase-fold protein [Roseburia sp.]
MQEYGKYEIEVFCPEEYKEKSDEVEYSKLIKTSYYSATCEKERNVNILLPAGYTEEKKYPVLYVLHGIFGTENDMTFNSTTIANMIAKGAAREMIVVYPYMYASKTQDVCTAIDKENVDAYNNFVHDLADDLMPYMKENYSIAEGRENTGIVGFSMGGRESLAIGLQRQDLFGYVGAIAPAPGLVPGKDWAMEHEGQFAEEELVFHEEKPLFLMICCGDSDKTVGEFPKSYHHIFEKNQVEHVWWEIPGSDHGNPAITSGIYNFCRNIFRD